MNEGLVTEHGEAVLQQLTSANMEKEGMKLVTARMKAAIDEAA